jgi:two-component system chemotaxis sensor kinase CheA
MDERLLREFLDEAEDLVEGLYGDVAALRGARGRGPERRELLARLFRRVHTLKGTAAAAGLDAAGRVAHEFESLLDAVRAGRAALDDEALDACEEAVGAVAESLDAAARGEAWEAPGELVARLRRSAADATAQTTAGAASAKGATDDASARETADDVSIFLPAEVARALTAQERRRLGEAVAEGARAYVVTADFDLSDFDEQYRRLSETLAEAGEVVSTQPFVNDTGSGRVGFRVVYASVAPFEGLEERAARFGATVEAALGDEDVEHEGRAFETFGVFGDLPTAPEDETSAADASESPAEDVSESSSADASQTPFNSQPPSTFRPSFASQSSTSQPSSAQSSTSQLFSVTQSSLTNSAAVRVPLEELDDLISTTHGLFADTLGALERARDAVGEGFARVELEARALGVRRRFFELEERLIGLRMVTLRGALVRAARAGRGVARAAGRSVEFEVEGGDARLDRSLAERVAEPLLHLVRNAVDHGVETEGERLAAGKPLAGRVCVSAESEAGLVILRVSDDGRGVDADAVARAAVQAGLVAPGARVTEEQALRLIFRPGFSTVRDASLVSGRGVGLDVVERAVEEAGGEVRVRSVRGRGTTFELRLPTTLALLPAHVVTVGGRRYCLADAQVLASGEAEASEVVREDARPRLRWRGSDLPLVELRGLLGMPLEEARATNGSRLTFVVARGRQGSDGETEVRAAVAVDALDGQSEVLVRSLGRHAKRWRGVAGATQLRDGDVALVLDLPRLLEGLG